MNTYTYIYIERERVTGGRERVPVEEEHSRRMVMSLKSHEQKKIKEKQRNKLFNENL